MENLREELERLRRTADMLASAHAHLTERYDRRALVLDFAILGLSLWLTAVALIDPHLGVKLTPFGMDSQLWVGLLGSFTFFLSIVQLRVDWKRQSDAHKKSFDLYAEVKRECAHLLDSGAEIGEEDNRRILARYGIATDVGTTLSETEFLREKQHHLMKVEVSKHLSKHPGASIVLLRMKIWWRDNLSRSTRE